ncbi:RING-H2 finger protein ATL11 (RING-type E3 ubiquitin transferase ATL11) [Durusdinium trenchii]|uniref:RING-H2 finger protein ATL11 (RING-type E3 ubiquitin transferase ATL11) n=1 Tax=Durusdinium trenchii TaxID=1381693 RepID=A0ABP0JPH9_9DINO
MPFAPASAMSHESGRGVDNDFFWCFLSVGISVVICLSYWTWKQSNRQFQDEPQAQVAVDVEKAFPPMKFRHSQCASPCSICLVDFTPNDVVRKLMPCGHIFHKGCIDMWIKRNLICPLCRADLQPLN